LKFALVTGASRGIGREFAILLSGQGYGLILVARDFNALSALKEELYTLHKTPSIIIVMDLGEEHAAEDLFQQVMQHQVQVEVLINNAGSYVRGPFETSSWINENDILRVSCITLSRLTKLFVREMLQNSQGYILNVASNGALVPGPYNAVYCASKAYILSFTEALAEEYKNRNIHISVLCPGGVNTQFQDLSTRRSSWLSPLMEAKAIASAGLKGLIANKRVIVPGLLYKLQYQVTRFIPRKLLASMAGQMVSKESYPLPTETPKPEKELI
jgi:short-subunit dehydrogenase